MAAKKHEPDIAPAATVVVLRDAAAAPEIFMVRRHERTAFMGGAFVFPGGRVDAADGASGDRDGVGTPLAGATASPTYEAAAIRELFEEAGILLARDRSGQFVSMADAQQRDRLDRARRDIHNGLLTMRQMAEREGLTLAVDALIAWAWWVTPPFDTRRFDTRFFLARMPAAQTSSHDDRETIDSRWTTAAAALDADRRNQIILPPPTWMTLRELLPFATVDQALTFAAVRPLVRREPRVVQENDARWLQMPVAPPAAGHIMFKMVNGQWRPPDWRRNQR